MTETKGDKPNFKSDGVAVWVNENKEGKKYLSIQIVGHNTIYAWKYEEKPRDPLE